MVYAVEGTESDAATADPLAVVAVPTDRVVRFLLEAYGFRVRTIDWHRAGVGDWEHLCDYRTRQRMSYVAEPAGQPTA